MYSKKKERRNAIIVGSAANKTFACAGSVFALKANEDLRYLADYFNIKEKIVGILINKNPQLKSICRNTHGFRISDTAQYETFRHLVLDVAASTLRANKDKPKNNCHINEQSLASTELTNHLSDICKKVKQQLALRTQLLIQICGHYGFDESYKAENLLAIYCFFTHQFVDSCDTATLENELAVLLSALKKLTDDTTLSTALKTAMAQQIIQNTADRYFHELITPGSQISYDLQFAVEQANKGYIDIREANNKFIEVLHNFMRKECNAFMATKQHCVWIETNLHTKLVDVCKSYPFANQILKELKKNIAFGPTMAHARHQAQRCNETRDRSKIKPPTNKRSIARYIAEKPPAAISKAFTHLIGASMQFLAQPKNQNHQHIKTVNQVINAAIMQSFMACRACDAEALLGLEKNARKRQCHQLSRNESTRAIGLLYEQLFKTINQYRNNNSDWHCKLTD